MAGTLTMSNADTTKPMSILSPTVLVTGAGYFVDIYDMLIFNIVRVPSLSSMGLSGAELTDMGLYILNLQMVGLLVGGFVWGSLADKFGRKSCLFASIVLYSIATLACGFVQDAHVYAWLRLACGFGLAGEVGVGVTLIAEQLPASKRGLGVGLFGFIGIMGAVAAGLVTELFDWRIAYYAGGAAGLLLLLARAMLMESGLFTRLDKRRQQAGTLWPILRDRVLRRRYVCSILVGVPIYFTISLVWTLAPEIAPALGVTAPVKASTAICCGYFAMTIGGFMSAVIGEWLRSRRLTILIYQLGILISIVLLLVMPVRTPLVYYALASLAGFFGGYWITMITLAAEQFATNIRCVAATTIPNFVRAATIPMNLAFAALKPHGPAQALVAIGMVVIVLAVIAGRGVEETHGKDLDYIAG